jgi:hypothetical protein
LLSVCVSVYPPVVARQRLGKSPLIVARQRLGKNPPIVARQRLGKNTPIVTRQRLDKNTLFVARQRLGENVTAVTNKHAKKNCWTRRSLCSPCHIKGKYVISSSQNFLLNIISMSFMLQKFNEGLKFYVYTG